MARLLLSIVESPTHPDFSRVYSAAGYREIRVASQRKAIAALKKNPPDVVVAEFFYGYGNNYAGVNISNLDVFLHSARKYAPQARSIVLVQASEMQHAARLAELFTLHRIIRLPTDAATMAAALDEPDPPTTG